MYSSKDVFFNSHRCDIKARLWHFGYCTRYLERLTIQSLHLSITMVNSGCFTAAYACMNSFLIVFFICSLEFLNLSSPQSNVILYYTIYCIT